MTSLSYRPITKEDTDLIYEWANDPLTRAQSFTSKAIAYDDHVIWFDKKLSSSEDFFFIFYDDSSPIGSLRLDKAENDTFIISYQVAPNKRGNGYGKAIISSIDKILHSELFISKLLDNSNNNHTRNIITLIAEVKSDNAFSLKCFTSNGYDMVSNENGIVSFKKEYALSTSQT